MAISVRAENHTSGNPVNTLTINAPAGTTTGDLVLVFSYRNAAIDGSEYIVDDNGSTPFTEARRDTDASNGASIGIFYRRIIGGDPSTYTFKHNAPAQGDTTLSLMALTFQNPDPSVVFDVSPSGATLVTSSGDSGSINAADITTTVNGCIHLIWLCREGSSTGFTNTPSGYTRPAGDGSMHGFSTLYYKTITTAGATGAQNLTGTGSGTPVIQSFAVRNTSGTQYNSSPSGVITHAGSLSAFIKLPKYTVKIG